MAKSCVKCVHFEYKETNGRVDMCQVNGAEVENRYRVSRRKCPLADMEDKMENFPKRRR